MEYPIPTHLQDYLIPVEGENNCEFQITGTIRCTCGCEIFGVSESNDGMLAQLRCRECGHEIALFDAGKHGWNGFVCHMDTLDRTEPFWKAACDACKGEHFRVTVWISSQGKEDFLEECVANDPAFTAEDWVDGFEWIQASLRCDDCKAQIENWLDFETM